MGYRKILVVINEHTGSTVAASYALGLAASGGAELLLYSTQAEDGDKLMSSRTERHLDHLSAEARTHSVAITRITESGLITRLLPDRAQAQGADLVIYPLTPRERYGSTLQRHTIHHLLRTVRTNLAVIRIMHMGKPHPRHILAPFFGCSPVGVDVWLLLIPFALLLLVADEIRKYVVRCCASHPN